MLELVSKPLLIVSWVTYDSCAELASHNGDVEDIKEQVLGCNKSICHTIEEAETWAREETLQFFNVHQDPGDEVTRDVFQLIKSCSGWSGRLELHGEIIAYYRIEKATTHEN